MTSELPKTEKRRTILGVFVPLLIILLVAWGALSLLKANIAPREGTPLQLKVGATIPDLTLRRVDGSTFKISESQARIVLINFWATWCEACMEEMPSLVKLHAKYRDKGVEIYGVNLDEDPAKAIASTTKEFGIQFISFLDHEGKLSDAFDVHAIPLTITLNRSRKILEIKAGDRDWVESEYLKKLDSFLAENP